MRLTRLFVSVAVFFVILFEHLGDLLISGGDVAEREQAEPRLVSRKFRTSRIWKSANIKRASGQATWKSSGMRIGKRDAGEDKTAVCDFGSAKFPDPWFSDAHAGRHSFLLSMWPAHVHA